MTKKKPKTKDPKQKPGDQEVRPAKKQKKKKSKK